MLVLSSISSALLQSSLSLTNHVAKTLKDTWTGLKLGHFPTFLSSSIIRNKPQQVTLESDMGYEEEQKSLRELFQMRLLLQQEIQHNILTSGPRNSSSLSR